ncbi:MAG: hypothetical protein ACPGJX_02440, partial [Alloalcanivorax venustensis]
PGLAVGNALGSNIANMALILGAAAVVAPMAVDSGILRREMPVLEQGQSDYPGVRFVYANQGESAEIIRGYLLEEGLRLDNVVSDPHSDLARALGGSGLPTTVLIGRDGTLVNSHVGPLSRASLHHFINPHLQE